MECEQYEHLLAQSVDRVLTADETALLDGHLSECSGCREMAELLRTSEQQLQRVFSDRRRVADIVAESTVLTLRSEPAVPPRSGGNIGRLVSLIGGFLAASILFLLLDDRSHPVPTEELSHMRVQPVAQFSDLTGPASCLPNGAVEWQTVMPNDGFSCEAGAVVKTPSGTLCELQTASGCRIRMDQETELAFVATGQVELRRGQVWCRSPADACFEIVARDAESAVEEPSSAVQLDQQTACVMSCPPETTEQSAGSLRVVSADGRVRLTTGDRTCELDSGATAAVEQGEVEIQSANGGPSVLTWMRPLLIRKSHDDPELSLYVNSQLAKVGFMKMVWVPEADIRSLGTHAVLPLASYLQMNEADGNQHRRRRAAALLADLSPVWMIPELIRLLDDEDPQVQASVGAALKRLTGVAADGSPGEPEFAAVYQNWWKRHGVHRTVPPPGGLQKV